MGFALSLVARDREKRERTCAEIGPAAHEPLIGSFSKRGLRVPAVWLMRADVRESCSRRKLPRL
jgi:hypothetical protein